MKIYKIIFLNFFLHHDIIGKKKEGMSMSINARTLRSLVPISQFSKGKATQVFERLRQEPQLVVLKNNVPAAVLLSPEEFSRLAEVEENYQLLLLAQERLASEKKRASVTEQEVMEALGISEEDIESAEDVELE